MFESDFYDAEGKCIKPNDIVEMLGMGGIVKQECGAWGVVFPQGVDWDKVNSEVDKRMNQEPKFCGCDNFISFWELVWNFCDETEDVTIDVLRITND